MNKNMTPMIALAGLCFTLAATQLAAQSNSTNSSPAPSRHSHQAATDTEPSPAAMGESPSASASASHPRTSKHDREVTPQDTSAAPDNRKTAAMAHQLLEKAMQRHQKDPSPQAREYRERQIEFLRAASNPHMSESETKHLVDNFQSYLKKNSAALAAPNAFGDQATRDAVLRQIKMTQTPQDYLPAYCGPGCIKVWILQNFGVL